MKLFFQSSLNSAFFEILTFRKFPAIQYLPDSLYIEANNDELHVDNIIEIILFIKIILTQHIAFSIITQPYITPKDLNTDDFVEEM